MAKIAQEPQDSGADDASQASEDDAPKTAPSRGISILDLIMRIFAIIATLGSAIAMGTTNGTFPSFTRFIRFGAQLKDFPTFRFFLVSNAITTAYLVLSLALSIFHILKTGAKVTRAVLIILDMTILALLTAGASAAAAIVYLAHKGNVQANWFAICQQYNSFCGRVSGSLVGSFLGALVLMLLISLSAVSMSRQ
ncbi:hypothetical protein BUALT_Bualt04G0143300 [Buddleja alternifolia]|uniref:CASP-like protein n=1 Tax=Buddleja alternifolia TaxID=168488 RepID=A0AAV6XNU8_9LAMI|nr:hypothetical protein BUALT_Bualt04G0143300 [Buddleja alternifolia]